MFSFCSYLAQLTYFRDPLPSSSTVLGSCSWKSQTHTTYILSFLFNDFTLVLLLLNFLIVGGVLFRDFALDLNIIGPHCENELHIPVNGSRLWYALLQETSESSPMSSVTTGKCSIEKWQYNTKDIRVYVVHWHVTCFFKRWSPVLPYALLL